MPEQLPLDPPRCRTIILYDKPKTELRCISSRRAGIPGYVFLPEHAAPRIGQPSQQLLSRSFNPIVNISCILPVPPHGIASLLFPKLDQHGAETAWPYSEPPPLGAFTRYSISGMNSC